MQEIQPLRFRRYVLRNRRNGSAIAIVEADSIIQAESRGNLLKTVTRLFEDDVHLVAERADLPMQLPTFLNSYFKMMEACPRGH
jgi:hypothetical protein